MVDETEAQHRNDVDRRGFVRLAGIAAVGAQTAALTASPARSADASRIKIIGLEEHFVTPALTRSRLRIPAAYADTSDAMASADIDRRVQELGDERLRIMDDTGVDMQVLSPAPGVQGLDPADSVPLARDLNDFAADMVRTRPDRFGGWVVLPTPDPAAAARELERGVRQLGLKGGFTYGRSRERNLDHPDMWPIFEAAAALNVPIYVHPQTPPRAVREVYPTSGVLVDLSPSAIIKGSRNPNAAKLFMEFLASTEVSRLLADGFEQPLRPEIAPPSGREGRDGLIRRAGWPARLGFRPRGSGRDCSRNDGCRPTPTCREGRPTPSVTLPGTATGRTPSRFASRRSTPTRSVGGSTCSTTASTGKRTRHGSPFGARPAGTTLAASCSRD